MDRGYEAVINLINDETGPMVNDIWQKLVTRLAVGKRTSLADVHEMFGLPWRKKDDAYILQGDADIDWNYLYRAHPGQRDEIIGLSVYISGVYKERKKSEWETLLVAERAKSSSKYEPEMDGKWTYEQMMMPL